MRYASPTPVPPSNATRSSSVSAAEKEVGPTQEREPGGVAPIEEGLDQKNTHVSAPPPNLEEMIEMLRRVLCFTDAEPPSIKMSDFFPLTKRISVNLGSDPPPHFRLNPVPIRHARVCHFPYSAIAGLHGSGDC